MAWLRIARKKCNACRCCWPSGSLAGRCDARKTSKACLQSPPAQRQDSAPLVEGKACRCSWPFRTRCWQRCRRPHPTRFHGAASLVRVARPAGAAGPLARAAGSTVGGHLRHDCRALRRSQKWHGPLGRLALPRMLMAALRASASGTMARRGSASQETSGLLVLLAPFRTRRWQHRMQPHPARRHRTPTPP